MIPGIRRRALRTLVISNLLAAASGALAVAPAEAPRKEAEVGQDLVVVAAELGGLWTAAGPAVHAPPERKVLVPGQRLAVLLAARGEGDERLLQGTTLALRLRFGGATVDLPARGPALVKRVKASGTEFASAVSQAGGIDLQDGGPLERLTRPAAIALFPVEWTAPEVKAAQDLVVEGMARTQGGARVTIAPARLQVLPWSAAAAHPPFTAASDSGPWFMDYARRPEPQHLAAALRLGASAPRAMDRENVILFAACALEAAPPGAADALRAAVSTDPPPVRRDAALALRWAGKDATDLRAGLPPDVRAELDAAGSRPDLHPLDASFEALSRTPHRMDLLWGQFQATGDPEPVRAIAALLAYRDDLPALAEYRDAVDKEALRPRVARAVLYRTAGWSLSAFVMQETLVADYVERWKTDPGVPQVVREELSRLLANEAFRPARAGD